MKAVRYTKDRSPLRLRPDAADSVYAFQLRHAANQVSREPIFPRLNRLPAKRPRFHLAREQRANVLSPTARRSSWRCHHRHHRGTIKRPNKASANTGRQTSHTAGIRGFANWMRGSWTNTSWGLRPRRRYQQFLEWFR